MFFIFVNWSNINVGFKFLLYKCLYKGLSKIVIGRLGLEFRLFDF